MKNSELLSLIGLIRRANKLCFGETLFKNFKDIKYLIVAKDISSNQLKRLLNKVTYYQIDYNQMFDSVELAQAIGKKNIKAIGIIDDNFSRLFTKKLKAKEEEWQNK